MPEGCFGTCSSHPASYVWTARRPSLWRLMITLALFQFKSVFDFPENNSLFRMEARLNPDNGLVVAKIKIPAIEKKYGNHYVYIQANNSLFTLETIVLSFHNGYIFIQTDKTIYTPGSIENHCTKLYHPVKEEDALNQVCQEGICR
ncbi:A.superbus venom factor 1-like isoform X2 [Sceloporus undulatus]|uniref:A.superbus venom factor 1-like isoform X2 n=1 Tax=Sceloporus undulatus TaxID=8520 RepID=UPI001C4D1E44|nr:A.superbus venom factor 1-like isoform X2 [Sceloporus undulatus]